MLKQIIHVGGYYAAGAVNRHLLRHNNTKPLLTIKKMYGATRYFLQGCRWHSLPAGLQAYKCPAK
ncbi:MAG: hypothetical protein MUF24_02865 [Chitinophagaceae bacterium]|nr:hypothetical protein [Chitinophagaceae bacterium]